MPAKDKDHEAVKNALIKDGWTITHDKMPLKYRGRNMEIDLGAERLLIAEKAMQKIAVEIKTVARESQVTALEAALGQYLLYLAIPREAAEGIFDEDIGQLVTQKHQIAILVYEPLEERIIAWKP